MGALIFYWRSYSRLKVVDWITWIIWTSIGLRRLKIFPVKERTHLYFSPASIKPLDKDGTLHALSSSNHHIIKHVGLTFWSNGDTSLPLLPGITLKFARLRIILYFPDITISDITIYTYFYGYTNNKQNDYLQIFETMTLLLNENH